MNEQAKSIPIPTQAGSSKNAHMTTCRKKVILSLNKIRFFNKKQTFDFNLNKTKKFN